MLAKTVARIDDHLNPIVVKEMRQAVRSRLVVGMLMFLLVVLLGAMTLFVIETTRLSELNVTASLRKGRDAFQFLLGLFVVVTMIFIPAYTAVRMSKERFQTVADLMFTTTLTPGAIVRGKFMVGMVLTILVFSAFLPFMVLTYFLRGVDLPSVFVVLIMAVGAQAVAVQFALCFACIPCSRVFKAIIGVSAGVVNIIFCITVISFAEELFRYGVGSRLGESEFWIWAALLLLLALLAAGLFHILAAAFLTPATANRALPVRGYLTCAWLITGLAALSTSAHLPAGFPLDPEIWIGYTVGALLAVLMISVSEAENQSLRIKSAIPQSRIKRIALFCFFSGPANGIAWTLTMMLLTFAAGLLSRVNERLMIDCTAIFLYSYSYILLGLMIRRKFLKWMPPKNTWMIIAILLATAHLAPLFVLVIIGVKPVPDVMYGNMIQIMGAGKEDAGSHFVMALAGAGVITILNLPWYFRQVKRFRPDKN